MVAPLAVPLGPHTIAARRCCVFPVRGMQRCMALPGGGTPQQTDSDLNRMRQQGGYAAPPPPRRAGAGPPPPPQQQPWSWSAAPPPPTQQQQQQQPWRGGNVEPGPDTWSAGANGGGSSGGSGGGDDNGGGGLSGYTKALIAAAFVTGLGAGVYFDAEINLSPNQVSVKQGIKSHEAEREGG